MLTVDDYGAMRRARRDGASIRKIARELEHSRRTVRDALTHAEPRLGPFTRNRPAPVLGPLHAVIDQILADDEHAPPKQRHTAKQVFRRLCTEHGYQGCYGQVQRYIRTHRQRHQETFIPLAHPPGQRLEADFGHIYVDFPDGRRPISFLVTAWAYSNYPFVIALPTERTEAILAGMVAAFDFFGAVPKEVWWDNPRTVAKAIFSGRSREPHPRYAALASHYAFDPCYCMPARGNEKPDAESTVKAVQRRFATPVPKVGDLDELNRFFHRLCQAEQTRTVESWAGPFVIGERFAEELVVAGGLPKRPFDACIEQPAVAVDKFQLVVFDRNRYSVPRADAFQSVAVKAYVDRVVIVAGGQVVAAHPRHYERCAPVLDPHHYLAALARRPAALDHAPVFRDWKLPACFQTLRAALEERLGKLTGSKQFIRVLQLLNTHPQSRVERAIGECQEAHTLAAEVIVQRAEALAAATALQLDVQSSCAGTALSSGSVPRPDLSRFNHLLEGTSTAEARPELPA